MARRSYTNINSMHFMIDSKSTQSSDKYSDKFANGSSDDIFFKGNDTINIPNLNDNMDKNIITINEGDEMIELDRMSLRETLKDLKRHAHTPVKALDASTSESFNSVIEALRIFYDSNTNYDVVLSDVKSVFSDIKDVKPGSVAAYFIGCFDSSSNFTGPLGCNPKCAASLPPSNEGYNKCDDLVLIYSDGAFKSINDKQSSNVYIYVESDDFIGFNKDNIDQLRSAKINTAILVFGNKDGSYRKVTSPMPISELPLNSTTNTGNANSDVGAGIAIFILIVIIIILFVFLFYRKYY